MHAGNPSAPDFNRGQEPYTAVSKQPLHALALIFPLIVIYQIGVLGSSADDRSTVPLRAERMINLFLDTFGLTGVVVPSILIVAILIIHHLSRADRWAIRPGVVAIMALEAVLWTLPLLVLGQVLVRLLGDGVPTLAAASDLIAIPWQDRLTISIGAGLFEELLFRMVLIAVLHYLLHDLVAIKEKSAGAIAIVLSSIAFALYHEPWGGAGIDIPSLGFYLFAGLTFAGIYLARGFGIVVAAHAFYDIIVLIVLPELTAS